MKRLLLLMVLLLSISVTAVDISEYPDNFIINDNFKGKIVVGKEAPSQDVATAILLIPGLQAESEDRIQSSILDEDVDDYMLHSNNIISIGCENTVTERILESECDFEEGAIILKESKLGMLWLVIAGDTSKDTEKAARVLAAYEDYDLSGNSIKVTGSASPYTISDLDEEEEEIEYQYQEEEEEPEADSGSDEEPSQGTEVEEDNTSEAEEKLQAKINRLLGEDVPEQPLEEEPSPENKDDGEGSFLVRMWNDFTEWLAWFF